MPNRNSGTSNPAKATLDPSDQGRPSGTAQDNQARIEELVAKRDGGGEGITAEEQEELRKLEEQEASK